MESEPHQYSGFLLSIGVGIASIVAYWIIYSVQGNTLAKIVVCDVGQGDGIYVRLQDGTDMVIDGGKDSRISECIGKYMPFFDKKIEHILLSHPHLDHYGGIEQLLSHYKVEQIYNVEYATPAKSYKSLHKKLQSMGVLTSTLTKGNFLEINQYTYLSMFWPTKEIVDQGKLSPPNDWNDVSMIFLFTVADFDMLFTGDAGEHVNSQIISDIEEIRQLRNIEVLKVSHHGSKTGMNSDFLDLLMPRYAIISAGKDNSFGHPAESIINMLDERQIPHYLTAVDGDVVVTTDGIHASVSTESDSFFLNFTIRIIAVVIPMIIAMISLKGNA